MSIQFKNIFWKGLKLLGIALVLIFLDSLLRYIIEVHNLIDVSPFSFPYGKDASPTRNVVAIFAYLSFLYQWYYLAGVMLYHYLVKKIKHWLLWKSLVTAIGICYIFFLLYWATVELFEKAILLEGLIVYTILGIVLSLLHSQLFSFRQDEGSIAQ